ncbi:hypothetical protein LSAT2_023665 [Lamellibrachia satsuma]|nr:hypothetical protein LSAT2_023665 [Lamellibrachia satsuma]
MPGVNSNNPEMENHLMRLATFCNLPESAPLTLCPSIVSKAGFYYSGEGGIVTCYSCGLCLNISEAGIHSMVLHSQRSPECQCVVRHQPTPMGEDTATERVSIDEVESQAEVRDSAMLVQSVSTGVTGSVTETSTAASPHGPRSLNMSRSQRRSHNRRQGNYTSLATYGGSNDWSMHYDSVRPVSSLPILNPIISHGARASPTEMLEINSLSLADSVLVNNDSPRCMMKRINSNDPSLLDEMKCERRRLVTYANWPRDTNIEPEALTQAGLFYLYRADCVKCAFCGGILRNWEPSEEPMRKHRHLFPKCPFLRNPLAAGNVVLGEEPTEEQTLERGGSVVERGWSDRERRRSVRERDGSDRENNGSDREKGGSDREKGRSDMERGGSDKEKGGYYREKDGSDKEKRGPNREKDGSDMEKRGPNREKVGSDRKKAKYSSSRSSDSSNISSSNVSSSNNVSSSCSNKRQQQLHQQFQRQKALDHRHRTPR